MISKFANAIILFILVFALTTLLSTNSSAQTGAISLDHTVGQLANTDSIACGQPIEFYLRATNNTAYSVGGVDCLFDVNSPDGATWSPIYLDTLPLGWRTMFDGWFDIRYYGVTGSGADTVRFFAASIFGSGLSVGFDSVSWIISTQVNCTEQGKTICIDSVTKARTFYWLWTSGAPTWDGPHCFTIINCCSGLRGDLNYDGKSANTLDLSFMVDYIFRGSNKPGDCIESRDINGDGSGPNILDLSFLVDYMFRGGPPPGPCP